tara:strand:- start:248 stop:997 length:750 start_codon:yes stop_codon:yes gene_type:complete
MKKITKILLLTLLSFSCSTKVVDLDPQPEIIPEESEKTEKTKNSPFYPVNETIENLQNQINELKSRVTEYESTLQAPSLNAEVLKLIKEPELTHEIDIDNGAMIQGKIIQENAAELIIKTRIGQLRIDKAHVIEIRESPPFSPEIVMDNNTLLEKNNQNILSVSGTLKNNGSRRGDFVRIIYHLWENDTKLVFSDSTFISGNTIQYMNGVISDASLNPGQSGTFDFSINIPDSVTVTYWTKEIRTDIFE